jgi:hypothetical protein
VGRFPALMKINVPTVVHGLLCIEHLLCALPFAQSAALTIAQRQMYLFPAHGR